jgi:phage terminase small subunit
MIPTNDRQSRFVEAYVQNGGNATAAMAEAGYSPDSANAARMVKKLSKQITAALQETMATKAGDALSVMYKIMMSEEAAPRDRLRACSEWLDRCSNLSRVTQTDVSVSDKGYSYTDDQGRLVMGTGSGAFILPPKQKIPEDED